MRGFHIRRIETREPFEAYLLPVTAFPIPLPEADAINVFLQNFCSRAMKQWRLNTEVFLQLEQLIGDGCRETFADHGKQWMPETGLGVWVDREPPKKWTLDDFKNLVPGDKLRPIMFGVFRISTEPAVRVAARAQMLPYGSVMEILTAEGDSYLEKVKPAFMHGITDRSYTCYPFYVGLLECKSLANATIDDLERWFTGMTIYIRESFEDRGIIIASQVPLGGIFEAIGGSLAQEGWRFP